MSTYVQHSDEDRRAMLERLGCSRIEDLWQDLPEDKVLYS